VDIESINHCAVQISLSNHFTIVWVQVPNLTTKRTYTFKVILFWCKGIVNKEIPVSWVGFVLCDDEGLAIEPSTLTNETDARREVAYVLDT